jgi:hypothetical protein
VFRVLDDVLTESLLFEVSCACASGAVAIIVVPSSATSPLCSLRVFLRLTDCFRSPHSGSGAGRDGRFARSPDLQCPTWPAQHAIGLSAAAEEVTSGARERKNESTRQPAPQALARILARETTPTRVRFTDIIGLKSSQKKLCHSQASKAILFVRSAFAEALPSTNLQSPV